MTFLSFLFNSSTSQKGILSSSFLSLFLRFPFWYRTSGCTTTTLNRAARGQQPNGEHAPKGRGGIRSTPLVVAAGTPGDPSRSACGDPQSTRLRGQGKSFLHTTACHGQRGYTGPAGERSPLPVRALRGREASKYYQGNSHQVAGSCPRHKLSSLLRLVPAPGISSRPSSDWFPPQGYPFIPPPIGSRPRDILLSLLRLVPAPGISSRPSSDWSQAVHRGGEDIEAGGAGFPVLAAAARQQRAWRAPIEAAKRRSLRRSVDRTTRGGANSKWGASTSRKYSSALA
eukprot:1188386-Prorocentrum_minimum.AAC.2